ncbi:hypothetical protein ACRRTK_017520 [Alexandromys fortis]
MPDEGLPGTLGGESPCGFSPSPQFLLYSLSFLLLPDSVYSQCEVRGTLGP